MNYLLERREFLKALPLGTAAVAAGGLPAIAAAGNEPEQTTIPRWRGFNLLAFFQAFSTQQSTGKISEDDLRWMRDWGFNYVRLPMDYWMWIDSDCARHVSYRLTTFIESTNLPWARLTPRSSCVANTTCM